MRPEINSGYRSDIPDIGNRPYYEIHTCHSEGNWDSAMDYKGIGEGPGLNRKSQ
ncbi:MAG: hypothetical protein K2O47_05310 [Muribaculaceae bacterium]|nr:hypothetical protein [Muribaculaceae bacterium]